MTPKRVAFLIFTLFSVVANAQNFTASFIKSVEVSNNTSNNLNPILELGSSVKISFDDLEALQTEYYYKIEHYTVDWKKSNLNSSEYIDGYQSFEIRDFQNSYNTLQNYIHYSFQLPNSNTKINRSGNYLLTIFNEYDEICIQRRIVFYKPQITVAGKIVRDRSIDLINKNQIVHFSIFHPNLLINNPNKELHTVILQNNDWNFYKSGVKPQFYKKNEIVYNYNIETRFAGLNEFLHFDSKDITGSTLTIARTELGENLYHNYLLENLPRGMQPYTLFPDINGGFKIRTLNGFESDIESDYTFVHFALDAQHLNLKKKYYVYGAFNNYAQNEENQLYYNKKTNRLETAILFKQGFYNYGFSTPSTDGLPVLKEVDGTFFQTENLYTVLVYYKPIGERIYSIIGSNSFYSR